MNLFGVDIQGGLELVRRVDAKYEPVFRSMDDEARAALAWYFLPHRSRKETLSPTRPRILKWYCPFADQRSFPSGHRYCINVYTGCSHNCEYCYAAGYEPESSNCKKNFEKGLQRDLEDLRTYEVPPAPVHLSNSTDPFQPLELEAGHTLLALKQIVRYRRYFTSVVLITKNPSIAARQEYLDVLKQIEPNGAGSLRMEISLAFWNDEFREFYDPGAPSIHERKEAIRELAAADIPIVLRIDPLLPRSPLAHNGTLTDFDLPEAQSIRELEQLVEFAKEIDAMHIVYSVAKVVQPRFKPMSATMQKLKSVYTNLAASEKLIFRGGSWRLPDHIAETEVVFPFKTICQKHNIKAMYCKQNLISTP